jgi:uncharacterized protein (DUF58 family)
VNTPPPKPPPLPGDKARTFVTLRVGRIPPPPIPAYARTRTPPPIPDRLLSRSFQRAWKFFKPEEAGKLQDMLFVAKTLAEGAYSGQHRSTYRGSSPEFVEYRMYNPGDPLDSIDWKAYARTDRYYIRSTEKETDLPCHIMIDCSSSMDFSGVPLAKGRRERVSKFDFACKLAAALTYLLIRQGDRVGLTLFDEKLRHHIPAGGTFQHLYRMLTLLEKQRPFGSTALPQALKQTHGLMKRRGVLIIFSDFYGDSDELFRSLGYFTSRRHEVLLFHVLHEHERELPPVGPSQFIDAETGESITCHPEELRERYTERVREFSERIERGAHGRRMDYLQVHTGQSFRAALGRYLKQRESRFG